MFCTDKSLYNLLWLKLTSPPVNDVGYIGELLYATSNADILISVIPLHTAASMA